jgi:hypothetical protein
VRHELLRVVAQDTELPIEAHALKPFKKNTMGKRVNAPISVEDRAFGRVTCTGTLLLA